MLSRTVSGDGDSDDAVGAASVATVPGSASRARVEWASPPTARNGSGPHKSKMSPTAVSAGLQSRATSRPPQRKTGPGA